MRLYTRTGAIALEDPEYGTITADDEGGFDFPDEVSDRLHSFHLRGKPQWETEIERGQRLAGEEMERRKDPATLLDAVQQILMAAQVARTATEQAAPEKAPPAKRAAKRPTTASE